MEESYPSAEKQSVYSTVIYIYIYIYKDFNMNDMHAEPPIRVIMQNQETVAMTSTAETLLEAKIVY